MKRVLRSIGDKLLQGMMHFLMRGHDAGKCNPCSWTNLLPMYLDYTAAMPNNDMHRSRRSAVLMVSFNVARRPGDVER